MLERNQYIRHGVNQSYVNQAFKEYTVTGSDNYRVYFSKNQNIIEEQWIKAASVLLSTEVKQMCIVIMKRINQC